MRRLAAPIACAALLLLDASAQVRPVYDMGAAGLLQALQRLQTTASVLHTGAHPDDEDSAFLARSARGDHARAAYLSLNRGEGGQNIIGPELFDALGVIRTEELLQARRIDGAEQFFTRAFDYGFSKTRQEAAAKWNEREVIEDLVRVIRTFRPLVIYSRWTGTITDGHGHHQFAGAVTPLAYKAAADANEFPGQLREGLRPWQAKKLYTRPTSDAGPTLQVQTGIFDPAFGRSYAEISFEGRSQHKSQAQGTIEIRGPLASPLRLIASAVEHHTPEQSLYDGIDTTIPGLAALAGLPDGALRAELAYIDDKAKQALREYAPLDPGHIVQPLGEGLRAVRRARQALQAAGGSPDAHAEADFLLAVKEHDFTAALLRSAGIVVDPLADSETVVQGGTIGVTVRTFLAQPSIAAIESTAVATPPGWRVEPTALRPANEGSFRRETPTTATAYQVSVPSDAPVTQPYYLSEPRQGDSYRWAAASPKAVPFEPPALTAEVRMAVGGIEIVATAPVEYRYADPARGELRRRPDVVPAVAVGLDSPLLIVPIASTPYRQRIVLRATSFSPGELHGTLRLRLPEGWTATPAEAAFTLRARGDQTSVPFTVTAPANRAAGTFEIGAEAVVGTSRFSQDLQVVAYPHIQTHRLYWPATAKVQVLALNVAPVRVGYIMGSGDLVPDALRRMAVPVAMIDADMLAVGDLSQFDTIVVGIRASEARPDFVANHRRLMQYAERGGTLIVQYQQGDYVARNLPPYPAEAATSSRVTDETAAVRILAPTHPVLSFPNRITAADFDGWVQERNLYAFTSFDGRYSPLLETADPGEPPQRGGELYAQVGKGQYVYTAYAWFRQLPAGVPGAYRQFANLISLSKATRRSTSR